MARYLVTGGAGFIGSHLCRALGAAGAQMVVLDDLSTGRAERLPAGAEFRLGDIRHVATVRSAMAGCDGCFHLAAVASVPRCEKRWADSHAVNIGGSVRVFEAARDLGNLPVVYASSAAVYGDRGAVALTEAMTPAPISAYGVDKYGCELHAGVGGRAFGLPTVGLRFFNVYGPGQNPDSPYSGAVSIFADRLLRGRSVDIHGDGLQTRDYIFVADVVRALMLAMAAASPAAPVINVCSGRTVSIRDLVHQLHALRGRRPRTRPGPRREGDLRQSLGDPECAARALGFRAEVPLAEGLEATLRHFEGELAVLARAGE